MNYFLSNLFRDRRLWIIAGVSALAGMMIMDLLTFMLTPRAVFGMWTFKLALIAAVIGAVGYGVLLQKADKKRRRLEELLPGFLEERRSFLEGSAAADPGFQTFCHECRHFDLNRLRCLLDLRERKSRILLRDDSPMRYCLYWNLDDRHPIMQVTGRLDAATIRSQQAANGLGSAEDEKEDGDDKPGNGGGPPVGAFFF